MRPTLLPTGTLLSVLLLLPACTFNEIEGNGTAKRPQVATLLEDRPAEELRALADDIDSDPDAGVRESEKGRMTTRSSGFLWPLLAGPWELDMHIVATDPDVEEPMELVQTTSWSGVLLLVVSSGSANTWDVATGRCLESTDSFSLTPLIQWKSEVVPASSKDTFIEVLQDRTRSADDLDYRTHSSLKLALGLLGGGTRNRCAFLKLLFFEIPLWSTE